MQAAGIIMECNPFHEGHRYILDQIKKETGGADLIVLMSGDFVQRGIPAVICKEERVKKLLLTGADLVLELPVCFAASSAEYFAEGAIRLLSSTGLVRDLYFGSESGDLRVLMDNARFLLEEPGDYRIHLRENLALGYAYPLARARAASASGEGRVLADTSNDVLGEEYCKAILRWDISMTPHALPRISADSATALRKKMQEKGEGTFADDFSFLLLEKLLLTDQGFGGSAFTDYAGVSEDLAGRIHSLLPYYLSWTQFAHLIKNKSITYSAVNRALVHILLGVPNDLVANKSASSYVRVLGCRKNKRYLLGDLQKGNLQVVTGKKDADRVLDGGGIMAKRLSLDLASSELYDFVVRMTKKEEGDLPSFGISEYAKPLILL